MHNLPFQVGQLAEFRSFEDGFRGAWFRCKIIKMSKRGGRIMSLMEYIDYPDEEIKWEEIYQKPPLLATCGKGKVTNKELMIRPSFPSIYPPSKMPDLCTSTEVFIVVDDEWKVGDYVDWWTDNCYWSGTIMEILGDKKVKLNLFPPPAGEGGPSHEVHVHELRPCLSWAPENGWMLPKYQDDRKMRAHIRIVKPLNTVENLPILGSEGHRASFSSHISGSSITLPSTSEQASLESSVVFDVAESPKIDDSLTAEPMIEKSSSQLEASMLNLEELVNKVKWIRGILEFGPHFPGTRKSSWQYSPHRA